MASKLFWSTFFLLCFVLSNSQRTSSFESDELQDEDDEWGLIGSARIEEVTSRTIDSRRPRNPSSNDASASASAADSRVQFHLQHSFGESDFSSAGVFTARLRSSPQGGQTLTKLRLSRNALTLEEQKAFEELVRKDGFYRIQIAANVLNPGQDSVLSSVKARCLAASNLQERFDFYMDRGNVIAVGYGASDCVYPLNLKYPTKWGFDSHIVLRSGEQAVRALTINDSPVGEVGEDGITKKLPEKSFWGKYWMYIVPLGLLLLNLVTQMANIPDEQPSSQGSAQGASQRAVTAGPRRR